MSRDDHRRERALIDRHFAGTATPGTEAAMRAHLGACSGCRDHYERHALLAQLDPRAPGAEDRLAAGLGFSRRPRPRAVLWTVLPLAGATAMFVLLLVQARPAPDGEEFSARGQVSPAQPELEVYRASRGHAARVRGDHATLGAEDGLAFAYRNPTGHKRLAVVGVDERGRVYWYHPDPDVTQAAIPIERHDDARELPESIRHQVQGSRLRVLGIFGDDSLSVGRVRQLIDASGCDGLRSRDPRLACVSLELTVQPRPLR
jgi:hypothetical protein